MNCRLTFSTIFSVLFIFPVLFASVPQLYAGEISTEADSVRTEKKGRKLYIVHRVETGETLYAISKKYGVSVEDLKKANDGLGNTLSVGQEIFIPQEKVTVTKSSGTSAGQEKYHTVEPGQTLYAISRIYNVSVEDIKSWNNLRSNDLSTGQKLLIKGTFTAQAEKKETPTEITVRSTEPNETSADFPYYVVQPSETLYSISRKFNVTVDELKKWNSLSGNSLSVGQRILVGQEGKKAEVVAVAEETPAREKKKEMLAENVSLTQINRKGYTTDTTSVAGYRKVIEEGFALVIENSPDTNKFLALHRTAPIGAILEVKNRMNDRSIYVRVVGTLPDTGVNTKILIRLSQKAFERLGSPDPRVPVQVSYVP